MGKGMTKFITGLILMLSIPPFSNADFIDFAEQNGAVENNSGTRAIYLGRIFVSRTAPPTAFTGIAAGVVLREADNVQLWTGKGVTFSSASSKFDTGLRFTNLSQSSNIPVFSPQIPNGSALPSNLNFATGLAMRNLLVNNNYLDFWLVGSDVGNGGFSAPSGTVGSTTSSFPFVVQLGISAVPEPSSLMLATLALIVGGFSMVRRMRNRSSLRR